MSKPFRLPIACRIAFISALCTPLLAHAADTQPVAASASGAVVKKTIKTTVKPKVRAKDGGKSAPGCDESNGAGKKGPSLPKCPEGLPGKIATPK